MINYKIKSFSRYSPYKGGGLINGLINKLPFELHLPGYNYCGPGTKLIERLDRGDKGVNPLDEACKEHDIAYSKFKDIDRRHIADKILASKAWERAKSWKTPPGERFNSWLVTNAMNGKVKLGMGVPTRSRKTTKVSRKTRRTKKTKDKFLFNKAVRNARKILKERNPHNLKRAIDMAVVAAKDILKNKENRTVKPPRIIPVPKVGGVLPFLLPLFAGLSAIGGLAGGASQIAKAVNNAEAAKKQLLEAKRHN